MCAYNIFKIQESTELFDYTEQFVRSSLQGKPMLHELEEKLGVINTCLDMDLYKKKHYYLVLILDKENFKQIFSNGIIEIMHSDLKEIDINEFIKGVGTNYEHFGFVGSGLIYSNLKNILAS